MSQTITISAVPGQQINQSLPATSKVSVVDLANGTPFDLTYSGFGCPDQMVIEAGLKVRLYHEVLDTGKMSILPVNNVGVAGTGIINVTAYFVTDKVPPGTFPVAIPTQIVSAKVSTVTILINDGSAAGTQIVESTPAGDASSAVSLLNTGVLVLGNATHKGSISSDNGAFKTDGSGNVTSTSETTGTITTTGIITIPNNIYINAKDTGGTARNLVGIGNDNNSRLWTAPSAHAIIEDANLSTHLADFSATLIDLLIATKAEGTFESVGAATLDSTLAVTGASTLTGLATLNGGLTSTGGAQTITGNANGSLHLGQAATGDTLDTTSGVSGNTYLKTPNSGGFIIFQVPNGTEIARINTSGYLLAGATVYDVGASGKVKFQAGTMTRFTGWSGTGSGTFNTNLGAVPNQIAFNPTTVSGSSQTIGGTNAQSSVVTTGAGLAFGAIAFKDV